MQLVTAGDIHREELKCFEIHVSTKWNVAVLLYDYVNTVTDNSFQPLSQLCRTQNHDNVNDKEGLFIIYMTLALVWHIHCCIPENLLFYLFFFKSVYSWTFSMSVVMVIHLSSPRLNLYMRSQEHFNWCISANEDWQVLNCPQDGNKRVAEAATDGDIRCLTALLIYKWLALKAES